MAMEAFFRALTLVSGLAQALIYGLGGYLAAARRLDPGTVVTMALLLNRLYAPLTALPRASTSSPRSSASSGSSRCSTSNR